MKIFPVPADDRINVINSLPGKALQTTYYIYNVTGEVVLVTRQTSPKFCLDITGLKEGNYILLTSDGSNSVISRFVIKHSVNHKGSR
jgi:hypothetical protein